MGIAFEPGSADLSDMSPAKPLWIEEVTHKTFIDVNEEGTEATAGTMVGVMMGKGPRMEHFTMIVDRPFFFAIRDNRSGMILFMGAVVEPG